VIIEPISVRPMSHLTSTLHLHTVECESNTDYINLLSKEDLRGFSPLKSHVNVISNKSVEKKDITVKPSASLFTVPNNAQSLRKDSVDE